MKVYKNLFNLIIEPENLFLAWDFFKRGKTNRPEVLNFESRLEHWNKIFFNSTTNWQTKPTSMVSIGVFGFTIPNCAAFIKPRFAIGFCTTPYLGFLIEFLIQPLSRLLSRVGSATGRTREWKKLKRCCAK